MIDVAAEANLYDYLRREREAVLAKLDGLSECDVRRPLTVRLFNMLVHLLADTSPHAGHADIVQEELDGVVGTDAASMVAKRHEPAFWSDRRAKIEASHG